MKARVVTNKEIKIAQEIAKKSEQDYMRRILKVICYVLHTDFGFGVQRLVKVINTANDTLADMPDNEVLWDSIDRKLRDVGLEFENEDYEEREQRSKELRRSTTQQAQRRR